MKRSYRMKQLFVTLVILVSAAELKATAGPSQQSADMKVLNGWLGIWKSHTVFKPAAWSLKAKELSGTSRAEWILDGHF